MKQIWVTGLLSEADACPNLILVRIWDLKISDSCPKRFLVRIGLLFEFLIKLFKGRLRVIQIEIIIN